MTPIFYNMKKKVGLYFGSFNPIHLGHLIVANSVLDKTDLEEVWFVITPMSPDKQNSHLLHHEMRYEILNRAVRDTLNLRISDIEFDMEQPNYTYKTLEKLRDKYQNVDLGVIMGSDNAIGLKQWVGIEHWQEHHKLYVVERPNSYLEKNALNWYGDHEIISIPEIGISATMIRDKVSKGESIKYLVPRETIDIIEMNYGTEEKD